jgi:hypothetical protein
MRQPGMLVLLSAPPGDAWRDAVAVLRGAGHLPIDAAMLEAALADGGPAAPVAARLASHCDAALIGRGTPLHAVFRSLRRPVYASPHQIPGADRAPSRAPTPWLWGLDAALRSLDR